MKNTDARFKKKSRLPDFVAVDIETTGLNKNKDRVIEIAAVKFIDGNMTEDFSTFINPLMPIPHKISQLTGITDEDVCNAVTFDKIMADFLEFIGRLAICGHNVEFDISFLNAEIKRHGGTEITNWNLDTLSLSRTILELEEGYALSKVARHLNISLEDAHRALNDAKASGLIAVNLIPKLWKLPEISRTRLAVNSFGFLKKIVERTLPMNYVYGDQKYETVEAVKPLKPFEGKVKVFDEDIVEKVFKENLPKAFEAYTFREKQLAFAQTVSQLFNDHIQCDHIQSAGKMGAIEAGTGTGKTLGYLVPALVAALQKNSRVVISTYTKQLQNQLLTKDFPILSKVMGRDFKFAVIKGKNNYVCRRAFEEVMGGSFLGISPKDRNILLPLITWYDKTKTGDIEEQNAFNRKGCKHLWDNISAENKHCGGCRFFDSCFLTRARKYAAAAHIVVVNHAFFYSDIIAGNDIIENSVGIIFDEAHRLEETGYYSLQTDVDTNRINNTVEAFQSLHTNLHNIGKSATDNQEFIDDVLKLKHAVSAARKSSGQFLEELGNWMINQDQEPTAGPVITLGYEEMPVADFGGYYGFLSAIDEYCDISRFIEQKHQKLLSQRDLTSLFASSQKAARQLKADIEYLCLAQGEDDVFWMEGPADRQSATDKQPLTGKQTSGKKWIRLSGTTTNICNFLSPFWKQYSKVAAFTSATLSPQSNMEYFADRVGISEFRPILKEFTSEISADRIFFAAPTTAPETGFAEHNAYTAQTVLELSERYGKNILVLFTNNESLNAVFEELNKDVKRPSSDRRPAVSRRPAIFAQGISGNNAWIQQQMKKVSGCVLLGSGTFWEGVDMPGKQCEIIVIPKLPFPVPTHPLQKRLLQNAEKDGQNGFMAYSLPETVLKFRQGIGRLIRNDRDRGALIVLDSRMLTRGYGKHFTKLVRSEVQKYGDLSEIFPSLDEFFGGQFNNSRSGSDCRSGFNGEEGK